MIYMIFIAIVAPLIMLMMLLKGNSKVTFGFTIIGISTTLVAYGVNSILNSLLNMSTLNFTVGITPVCEELLKSMPVLVFVLLLSNKKQMIIEISMAVGIGFAVLENSYLLVSNYENINIAWAIIRGFATGLMHGMTTSILGYGMIYVNNNKKLFYTGIFGLLSLSIMYHSLYNMLVQSSYYYIGFAMPITTYCVVFVAINKNRIMKKLGFGKKIEPKAIN